MKSNVGIIGCGLIGRKRAEALSQIANLKMCFDIDSKKSQILAEKFKCKQVLSVDEILESKSIEAVIIATTHDTLAQISEQAIKYGKHVFIEKPGAINLEEFQRIVQKKINSPEVKIHIGYNHRFHGGIRKALEVYEAGEIGEIMFLRARYGHGGRLGYENEWRSVKKLAGGGELIDQGSHLLDLSIAFLGDVTLEYSAIPNYFWNMEVEDNAFISVRNSNGNIAFLHASCTEWKNTFSLEVYGKSGKIEVSGLGGSYGIEKVIFYKMLPEMGPPKTKIWEFPSVDNSWELELHEFFRDIQNDSSHSDNLTSSKRVLEIISQIYGSKLK